MVIEFCDYCINKPRCVKDPSFENISCANYSFDSYGLQRKLLLEELGADPG
jgi:hypothetical protein